MRGRIRHHDRLRIQCALLEPAGVRLEPRGRVRVGHGLTANTTYHFRISATNPGGTSKGSDETFKTLPNAPSVESITPNQGPAGGGTSVKITGKGFLEGASVTIGAAASEVTFISATELTARTPAGTGTQEVIVKDEGGTSTLGPSYSYIPAPSVVTGTASSLGQTSVTLERDGQPQRRGSQRMQARIRHQNAYGPSAPCTPSPGSGTTPVGRVRVGHGPERKRHLPLQDLSDQYRRYERRR